MEEEVVLLKAVQETIDEVINHIVIEVRGKDPHSEIWFRDFPERKYFNIIVLDLLSGTHQDAPIQKTTYLGGLRAITDQPAFDVQNSIELLRESVAAFSSWLDHEVKAKTWFPSIDKEVDVVVSRLSLIKMCGNLSKHNFLRTVGVARELRELLHRAGVDIGIEDSLLCLAEFYDQFHDNIFAYHVSTIAEFLNEIRWGIYMYLQPELRRSTIWDKNDPDMYRYDFPADIQSRLAKECYWNLLNEVRQPPFVRRFQVTKWLKLRY